MWMHLSDLGRYSLNSSTTNFNNDNSSHCQVLIDNYLRLNNLFDINTYYHYRK